MALRTGKMARRNIRTCHLCDSWLIAHCRPSAVPKGTVSTPVRSDGRVVQSLLSQREAVLEDLGIDDEMLEVRCNHIAHQQSTVV